MFAAASTGRPTLLALADGSGRLDLLRDASGGLVRMNLPGLNATDAQILSAVETAPPVALQT